MTEIGRGPVVPQVERLLREWLRDGRWQPGQRLPNETALATELTVGRSSVREAIRLLVHDGLLEVRHGSGTFVLEPSGGPDAGRLLRTARLAEVYEVRRALEVEGARLAATRARPEEHGRLRERLATRSVATEAAAFVDADLAFHREVLVLSGNAVLAELFDAALPTIRAALLERYANEGELPESGEAHAALAEAVERGAPDAAMAATVEYLEPSMRLLEDLG